MSWVGPSLIALSAALVLIGLGFLVAGWTGAGLGALLAVVFGALFSGLAAAADDGRRPR